MTAKSEVLSRCDCIISSELNKISEFIIASIITKVDFFPPTMTYKFNLRPKILRITFYSGDVMRFAAVMPYLYSRLTVGTTI